VTESVADVRERAFRLGYRLEHVEKEDRWRRHDLATGRLVGGSGMTYQSVLRWLDREEAKR
jgi:hypothetical protein